LFFFFFASFNSLAISLIFICFKFNIYLLFCSTASLRSSFDLFILCTLFNQYSTFRFYILTESDQDRLFAKLKTDTVMRHFSQLFLFFQFQTLFAWTSLYNVQQRFPCRLH